jgi:hypothetical protein
MVISIVAEIPDRTPFRFPVSGLDMTIRELKAGVACYLFLTPFTPTDIEVRVSGRIVNDFSSLADSGLGPGSSVAVSITNTCTHSSHSFPSLGQGRADVEACHVDQQITMCERAAATSR